MTEHKKSKRPYFSIITASFNRRSTIQETVISISGQSFQNFEHIVIDGGSRDNTVELLKEYEHRYPLHWISEPDNGIADALNKGLRISNGQYIIVLHADDSFINSETLASVFAIINRSQKDIYSFPVLLDHPTRGLTLRKPIRHLWYNRFKFIFLHQGSFIKRIVFDEIGGFNTSFKIAMDYDFFYRALTNKYSVEFFTKPVALMGGSGIGTITETANCRLKEEQLVQLINEENILLQAVQRIFWRLYIPYKKWHLKISK